MKSQIWCCAVPCRAAYLGPNIYICLANIPPHEIAFMKFFLASFLETVYGLPLKWEPHTMNVVWREGCFVADSPSLFLLRKGCVVDLRSHVPNEWDSWISSEAPHARMVWKSHFCALVHKSLWYALSLSDINLNLRSLMQGVGIKGYPDKWWSEALGGFYKCFGLKRVVLLKQLKAWRLEGVLY